jgi:triosephosphate isomerase
MATSSQSPRRLVGVSYKMYFDHKKHAEYVKTVLEIVPPVLPQLNRETDIFLIPDFLHVQSHAQRVREAKAPIWIGAQDAHHEDGGAYTGEVSPKAVSEVGGRLIEMGHAERRRLFGETDEWVVLKAKGAARNGLIPLICIGEQSKEGGTDNALAECWKQVHAVFQGENAIEEHREVILAYEPVWAIGKSEPASAEHVIAVTKLLRRKVEETGRSGTVRILYGGSAGPGLFDKISEGVDGLFLGRFGHDPQAFLETIKEVGGGLKK